MKDGSQTTKKSIFFNIDKRLYVVLVCFFIACIFWMLLALSHIYTTTIIFPVTYTNLPGKKVIMNDLPTKIGLNLKTTGFKIISFGLNKEQNPLKIDVAEKFKNEQVVSDFLAIPTESFLKDFAIELGNDISILGFEPDSIVFNFSDVITKKVPVVFNYKADFEKQFDSTGKASVTPAFVDVSGPPSLIEKLISVSTEPIHLQNVKSSVTQKVKLVPNRLLLFNVNEVEFKLPVEKFTEGTEVIDVHPINVSPGYSLKTFPDKVKVRYLVPISEYNLVDASMFDAVVDGDDKESSPGSKLEISMITSPTFVKITRLEPDKVDYILRRQ